MGVAGGADVVVFVDLEALGAEQPLGHPIRANAATASAVGAVLDDQVVFIEKISAAAFAMGLVAQKIKAGVGHKAFKGVHRHLQGIAPVNRASAVEVDLTLGPGLVGGGEILEMVRPQNGIGMAQFGVAIDFREQFVLRADALATDELRPLGALGRGQNFL